MKYAKWNNAYIHYVLRFHMWKWIVSMGETRKPFNGCFVCEMPWDIIMDDRILYLNDDRKFLNASFDCKHLQSEFSTYLIMVVVKCSINARSFQWATFIYILLKHFYGKKIAKIVVSYQQIFNALDSTSWYFRS